jgi:hypothetical protein
LTSIQPFEKRQAYRPENIIKEPEKAPVLPGLSFIGQTIFLNHAALRYLAPAFISSRFAVVDFC